jgi:hypothetical protein
MAITFYIWKDDELSTPSKVVTYITDYLEKDKTGKIRIDGHGWRKCTLITSGPDKMECIATAQKKITDNQI